MFITRTKHYHDDVKFQQQIKILKSHKNTRLENLFAVIINAVSRVYLC